MTAVSHTSSWYAATAHPHPAHAPLLGARTCDVCVVGGGFTGLSAALDLAARGYRVVLLEAHRIGWGASGRNGGQIVAGFNRSMDQMVKAVGQEDARRLWDLALEATALLGERVQRHAIDCDLAWGYVLGALKRRHMAELEAAVAEWSGLGYDAARMLDGDAIRAAVACPRYVGGLYDAGSGQLHPLNYALGLATAAIAAGVEIYERTAAIEVVEGPRLCVRTVAGEVGTDFLILAGNAYLPSLSPAVERVVRSRVMPVSTYMIATAPLGPERARALIPSGAAVADLNFVLNYYRLSSDHRLLFGGGVSYSRVPPPGVGRTLRRTMLRFFPQLADIGVDYAWGGDVAITRNRIPHFGWLGPRILFAQGFSGHGVALTGLAGRLMAEAIAGSAERFDVFARYPHHAFAGGRLLRLPALVLAMAWFRLRDLL